MKKNPVKNNAQTFERRFISHMSYRHTNTLVFYWNRDISITPILLCTGDGLDALRRVVLGAMASSLGRRKHTAVWPSLEVMVGPGDGGQEVGGHFDSPLIVVD